MVLSSAWDGGKILHLLVNMADETISSKEIWISVEVLPLL